ncbi:MAG: ABC transporter substrate-binding protein [Anaerolineae bacterium]
MEQAKQLLDDAGCRQQATARASKDGTELVLRYATNQRQIRKDVQAVVQQDFAAIGIKVDTFNYDNLFDSYGEDGPVATGDFDIAEWSDAPYFPDPDTAYFLCSSSQ